MRIGSKKKIMVGVGASFGVAVLAFAVSFFAGRMNFFSGQGVSASGAVSVTEEVVDVVITQSSNKQFITQTSELTITDAMAVDGYIVTAKLIGLEVGEDPLDTEYIMVYSDDSEQCPNDLSCQVPFNGNEIDIYREISGGAPDGKVIQFKFDFTAPAEVVVGVDHLRIEYNLYRVNATAFMQNFTQDDCAYALGDRDVIVVFDERDGRKYRVKKFVINGASECWMIDNLELGYYDSDMLLTPDDTDIATNYTLAAGLNGAWFNIAHYLATGATASFVSNYATDADYCIDNSNSIDGYTKCGNIYAPSVVAGGVAPYASICPKGWTLPVFVSGSAGYARVFTLLGNAEFLSGSGFNAVIGGYMVTSMLAHPDYFYTNEAYFAEFGPTGQMYYRRVYSSGGTDNVANSYGMNVRCVVKSV